MKQPEERDLRWPHPKPPAFQKRTSTAGASLISEPALVVGLSELPEKEGATRAPCAKVRLLQGAPKVVAVKEAQ